METPGLYRTYIGRLGTIFSNWAILSVVLTVLSMSSFLLIPLYAVFVIIAIVLTVGLIFKLVPGFWQSVLSTTGILGSFVAAMQALQPVFAGLTLAFSVLSGALLLAEYGYRRRYGRIVFSAIAAVFAVIALVIILFRR